MILDGKALSKQIQEEIKTSVDQMVKAALYRFNEDISETELLEKVKELNENEDIDGFIVQLPLPKHIDANKVNLAIDYRKDVDGFHPINIGKMVQNLPSYLPATPYGIIQLLERNNVETSGKECVVVGRSNIVGSPMSILMARNAKVGNCTVTLTHSRTKNLIEHTKRADILVVALGIPNFITADMVKDGVVVIDVGITRVEDASKKRGFRLVGDVNYEEVAPKSSWITPVPGGVGPMTVTSLLMNTLQAAKQRG
ncbi:UNVERIFIED_CONTAM: hypothetical protein GTU68_031890 [Idotea baltica]|nr:hypothetical protein [Idotea baltica]